jgi:hypothetical protein
LKAYLRKGNVLKASYFLTVVFLLLFKPLILDYSRADQQVFLQGMGQIQKAMEVYEKAMDIAPDNDEAKQGRLSLF